MDGNANYGRPDVEYAGRVLPGDWASASGGRIYARYKQDGKALIRMVVGADGQAGWRWKAEVIEKPDGAWIPFGGSTAAFGNAARAKAQADEFLESYFRDQMTAKGKAKRKGDWRG